jgi:hypothetical protein
VFRISLNVVYCSAVLPFWKLFSQFHPNICNHDPKIAPPLVRRHAKRGQIIVAVSRNSRIKSGPSISQTEFDMFCCCIQGWAARSVECLLGTTSHLYNWAFQGPLAIETWQIGALVRRWGLIFVWNAYFGPILPPVRIWEEVSSGHGGSSGDYDGCHLVYGTI